jgi:hypothetical protein
MKSDTHDQVRWVGWIFSVLIAPLIGSIFAAPLAAVLRHGGTAFMFCLWVLAIGVASIRQSRALARQKCIHRFIPTLGVWLCVTLSGTVISLAIWSGTCAIITQGGRLIR